MSSQKQCPSCGGFCKPSGCERENAPRTWVSLTDDEIKEIIGNWGETPVKGYTRKLIDQIDAKLKELNT